VTKKLAKHVCLILHIRKSGMKSHMKLKFYFLVTILQNGIPASKTGILVFKLVVSFGIHWFEKQTVQYRDRNATKSSWIL